MFYIGVIGALLVALLLQGAKLQRVAPNTARAVAASDLYREIRAAPEKYQLVDLRDAAEFEDGHLPQAVNLKPDGVPKSAPLDRYKRTVIVTEEGDQESFAALAREFKLAMNLDGGMMQWRMSRLPEVSGLTDTEGLRRGRAG
ncbi:MAG: hypothetical protein A2V91_05820 [Candidatus Muproteobacteria bacterium RBG_16_64_10]|uniref:Rhodanese domain-containing protein n=1 Tax=Candidatus Muproteobacteria bacterium RBG_16_64_10 TaxID=1817757 RepID=A0A1F6T1I5_9PROT|nr:MAG: hypothetical protein A2V91_05820 [Candidatus Muproteobacteria bacterium RBG_16_64_10]